nr:hypothetical protein Iba_chr04bCG13440 [Ipomoea batatas]
MALRPLLKAQDPNSYIRSSPTGVREMAARTASPVSCPLQICRASRTGSVKIFSPRSARSRIRLPVSSVVRNLPSSSFMRCSRFARDFFSGATSRRCISSPSFARANRSVACDTFPDQSSRPAARFLRGGVAAQILDSKAAGARPRASSARPLPGSSTRTRHDEASSPSRPPRRRRSLLLPAFGSPSRIMLAAQIGGARSGQGGRRETGKLLIVPGKEKRRSKSRPPNNQPLVLGSNEPRKLASGRGGPTATDTAALWGVYFSARSYLGGSRFASCALSLSDGIDQNRRPGKYRTCICRKHTPDSDKRKKTEQTLLSRADATCGVTEHQVRRRSMHYTRIQCSECLYSMKKPYVVFRCPPLEKTHSFSQEELIIQFNVSFEPDMRVTEERGNSDDSCSRVASQPRHGGDVRGDASSEANILRGDTGTVIVQTPRAEDRGRRQRGEGTLWWDPRSPWAEPGVGGGCVRLILGRPVRRDRRHIGQQLNWCRWSGWCGEACACAKTSSMGQLNVTEHIPTQRGREGANLHRRYVFCGVVSEVWSCATCRNGSCPEDLSVCPKEGIEYHLSSEDKRRFDVAGTAIGLEKGSLRYWAVEAEAVDSRPVVGRWVGSPLCWIVGALRAGLVRTRDRIPYHEQVVGLACLQETLIPIGPSYASI